MTDPLSKPQRAIVEKLLSGEISPAMALTGLCAEAPDDASLAAAVAMAVAAAPQNPAVSELADLAAGHPEARRTIRSVLAVVSHDGPDAEGEAAIARTAAMFDAAADLSPEASVALYSLGDPARLEAVTAEVVAWLGGEGVLRAERDVLEIGCGIGRFLAALAPRVRSVTGLDVSSRMVEIARTRTVRLPNVEVRLTDGRDLADVADAAVDLVLAIDVFPYLVQAGADIAARMVGEAARVLRPGGDFVVLNWSYGNSADHDGIAFEDLCGPVGLQPLRVGERPFREWDGAAFRAIRPGRSRSLP